MNKKVRIGIDVGGTFTDAVVIDNDTYEIIAKAKIPTTHNEKEGVARGIVEVIQKVLREQDIDPADVMFIAHGTTQATNALLEGDVAKVGILGMGRGIEGERAKGETNVGNIDLSTSKQLYTNHTFLDTKSLNDERIGDAIDSLVNEGAEVIVASEAYSVDDATREIRVIEECQKKGIYATGGYEISQLYGLMSRTRTAVVNAALIPKMMETANMTEESVKQANITKPLMIMRCDGGVMNVDEVRKRPILTMLSGLAAGVAGALMYEKVSDGIFLEVGGTSTDISVIKDGKVMIKNAQIGGHKLYLTSLDVRTLGIAGGSMICVEDNKIVDVGPRSAHIALKEYECFTDVCNMKNPVIRYIAPKKEDHPNYVTIQCDGDNEYALTLAGAANILGYIDVDDYAYGNKEAARIAWQALSDILGISVEDTCRKALDIASMKIKKIVDELISEYKLNTNIVQLVGGGGSASVLVPYLSEKLNIKYKIAENAPFISTIGVALALVREQIERNVTNPSDDDIKKIRAEVMEVVIKAGASADTVEIAIEVDGTKNILRAIATGATELRTKDLNAQGKNKVELDHIVRESFKENLVDVKLEAQSGRWFAYSAQINEKKLFGLITSKKTKIRIVDQDGVIRLQKENGKISTFKRNELHTQFSDFLDCMTTYSDAGATLPKSYMYFNQKQIDLTGVSNKTQLLALANVELEFVDDDTDIIAVLTKEL